MSIRRQCRVFLKLGWFAGTDEFASSAAAKAVALRLWGYPE
jgi:hypothetical protein